MLSVCVLEPLSDWLPSHDCYLCQQSISKLKKFAPKLPQKRTSNAQDFLQLPKMEQRFTEEDGQNHTKAARRARVEIQARRAKIQVRKDDKPESAVSKIQKFFKMVGKQQVEEFVQQQEKRHIELYDQCVGDNKEFHGKDVHYTQFDFDDQSTDTAKDALCCNR